MEDNGSRCKITIDGTDCPINEPGSSIGGFSPRWYCHKTKGPGIRYEIGISLQRGDIVWVNGPYPCGTYPDLKIARGVIIHQLLPGEKIVADSGYRDRNYFDYPTGFNNPKMSMQQVARSRHETCNARFKNFKIFSTSYRGELKNHYSYFTAIAVSIQISIDNGKKLFQIKYDDTVFDY